VCANLDLAWCVQTWTWPGVAENSGDTSPVQSLLGGRNGVFVLPQDYYNYTSQPASRRTLVNIAGDAGWKQGTTRECSQDCCLSSAPRATCNGHK